MPITTTQNQFSSAAKSLLYARFSHYETSSFLRNFAECLKKAGKQGKVIVCAVMRKLIHVTYTILFDRGVKHDGRVLPSVVLTPL